MLEILTVKKAQQTILRRDNWLQRELPQAAREQMQRIFGEVLSPDDAVKRIVDDVRQRGDAAVSDWTQRIDGVQNQSPAVAPTTVAAAFASIPDALRQALELAADRIKAFHSLQPLPDWTTQTLGGKMGQRVRPLARVGVYVPGGTAPLPSSLLMSAIPAKVAGVEEVAVATPPSNSGVSDVILAAAAIAGVNEVYAVGGAQAIAALAFGTEAVRAVDKIVGPGNLYVTLAKRLVYGIVGVDGLYGPTETVVIADDTANPAWVAADLLAQAEHDILATAILLTPSRELATAVQLEVGRQIETLSRAEIIAASFAAQGGIVITRNLEEAAELADAFAAEHLCLDVADPERLARQIDSAGGLFLGERSYEVLGDYVAGPSHTMPTSGTARFASPLNVLDFVRINSIVHLDELTSQELSEAAALIAEAEQLTAHANAARIRMGDTRGSHDA